MISSEALMESGLVSKSYRFVFPERSLRGRNGELLGKNVGGAIEFHDHRPYFMGDDVRHIDWLVYGRSNELVLKSYREEITPSTEIVADFSRSMGINSEKENLARALGLFLMNIFKTGSITPVLWKCGESPDKIQFDHQRILSEAPFNGRSTIMEMISNHYIRSRPNSMRIVISDFLFPFDPGVMLRRVSANAAGLLVIQVLSPEDTDPQINGGFLLEDCETSEEFSMRVTPEIVGAYQERVRNISSSLERTCRQLGAGFVLAEASKGLHEAARRLVIEGYLEPV